ncbi:MAG: TylF/MycF family methyltransferase [Proteobacteria bacterium]|nr:TylF/MycF family methyltransferase [Pseudomonadota bacterium]
MNIPPDQLYLDLLKKTLSFSLWPDPPVPAETFAYRRSALSRSAVTLAGKALKRGRYRLVEDRQFSRQQREDGMIWPGYADTMIGLKRLDNLQQCIESALRDDVPGDIIETGVWRGGACILARAVLAAHGVTDRRVFVADSFEGLPKPDADTHPADKDDTHHVHGFLAISQEQVAENFRKYGLLDGQVVFLKGWFKDTLPTAPIERLAVMRLDGDMYGSTIDALNSLYPRLSSGGYCIIDDYALEGCKQAVTDYRAAHGIHAEMTAIDWTGTYWRKA